MDFQRMRVERKEWVDIRKIKIWSMVNFTVTWKVLLGFLQKIIETVDEIMLLVST